MSICSAVMPLDGAGHLEVHVAVVIFGAGDVRQDRVLAGLLVHDEAHRDARHRRAQRHARIHHRQRAAADRRHRRRSVRLEDVRHDANRVGERFFRRKHRQQRALGERAVADFAAAGPAHELHFADRERREVVVQHEPAVDLAFDRFDLLLVVRRAERDGDERLRFAAREHRRAVHARQHADLRPDRPDLVELAAVETHALLEHFVAQHFFLELLEDGLGFDLALHFAFGNRSDQARSST